MTAELNYQSLKTANQAREADEARLDQRRKNVLVLVHDYLKNSGYCNAANTLEKETNLSLDLFHPADNVDLETVLQEYESYYFVKFQRHPRIIRKNAAPEEKPVPKKTNNRRTLSTNVPAAPLPKITPAPDRPTSTGGAAPARVAERKASSGPPVRRSTSKEDPQSNDTANGDLQVNGTTTAKAGASARSFKAGQIIDYRALMKDAIYGDGQHENPYPNGVPNGGVAGLSDNLTKKTQADYEDKFLKPVGALAGYNAEMRELAVAISKEIYLHSPDVKFDDIIGLDNAKRLVKESVVYPIKYPELFQGILSPWKGLLLYGPPGTGKTLLAKAVATECNTTFFNISASSIVSKWRGDSEKLVKVLFDLARFHAPSTIFVDELESLMSQRGEAGGTEHEGSRRMKTELLIQMDGLARSDDLVFLLAASNLPWMLDHAMLRRLEKRILVGLPNCAARSAMYTKFLPPVINQNSPDAIKVKADVDYQQVAQKSDGYSGSDIHLVCKEAAMSKVRKVYDVLEAATSAKELPKSLSLETITTEDVLQALRKTKPSAKGLKEKYSAWQAEFESG